MKAVYLLLVFLVGIVIGVQVRAHESNKRADEIIHLERKAEKLKDLIRELPGGADSLAVRAHEFGWWYE